MLLHKKLIVTVSLLSTIVFVATTSMQSTTTQEPQFKNLKVLPKDISKEALDKVMDEWRDALGVRCGFCHARTADNKADMASDAKPEKLMARKMYEMTGKINKKFFKMDKDDKAKEAPQGDGHTDAMVAAVTCMTCHHGAAHPNAVAVNNNRPGGFNNNQGPPPPPAPPTQKQ
ncbi:c-type cytochrome [uncultured Mucilaginibacter sp.]|uniref:c-type cytochrome n=1 Tax=uncultured Mucilaginibacter sp. TaxID=797541 RepID=UPI0025F04DE1|nr:c-type cytochrome [uncultured Mucilaginibacter sp.]